MIVLGAVLLVLILINLIPIGVTALYDDKGAGLWLKIGFFSIKAYPLKEKEKPPKKPKRKKAEKEKPEQTAEKGDAMELISQLFPLVRKAAGMFKRALRINELTVYYLAAGGDAAKTAMQYGAGWAAVGMVTTFLENLFSVNSRDLRVFADFRQEAKPKIYVKATLTIRIYKLSYIACVFGIGFLKKHFRQNKNTHSEKAVR